MENQTRRLLNKGIKQPENVVKLSSANTILHETIKSIVVYILRQKGKQIITEAEFETRGRADILNLTDGIVFEILHTEDLNTFQEKLVKYPSDLEIEAIQTAKYKSLSIEQTYTALKKEIDKKC